MLLEILPFEPDDDDETTRIMQVSAQAPVISLIHADHVVATWHNVLICVWHTPLSLAALPRTLAAAPIALEPPPEGVGILHVARSVEPDAWAELSTLVTAAVHGVAVVTPEHHPPRGSLRRFGTVEDAAAWLVPRLRAAGAVPMTPGDLVEAARPLAPRR